MKLTHFEALDFLVQAGWTGGETLEVWESFNKGPSGKAPWKCSNGHLQLYSSYLQWTLEVPLEEMSIVDPLLILRWLQATKDHQAGKVSAEEALAF